MSIVTDTQTWPSPGNWPATCAAASAWADMTLVVAPLRVIRASIA